MSNKVLKSEITLNVRDSEGWSLYDLTVLLTHDFDSLIISNSDDGSRVNIPVEFWEQLVESGDMLLSQIPDDEVEVKPEYEIYRDK